MKYKFLLFDADETLLDFKLAEKMAFSATLKHFNLLENDEAHEVYSQANAEQWALLEKNLVTKKELKSNRFKKFCDRFGYNCDPKEMSDVYILSLADQSHLIDGALELIKALSSKFQLYIITNGFKYSQTKRIKNSPIYTYFKGIFISEEMGFEKPDKRFFENATNLIDNFNKAEAIIIGDSPSSDILGGMNFGIDTCWYNPNNKPLPNNIKPTYIISELDQIKNIL